MLLAIICALMVPKSAAQDFRYYLDTTVTTNYGASDLCYNPLRGKMYCVVSDTVLGVIDSTYGYTNITGFNWNWPRYLAYNPNRDVIYTCGTYNVFVIDGQTNAVIDTSVGISEGFDGLVYDSTSNRLYAAGGGLSVLHGTTDSLLKVYNDYFAPLFLYRPSNKVMAVQFTYDTLYNPVDTFLMVIRDTLVLDSLQVPGLDYQSRFAANEARGKIYISIPNSNRVVIIDDAAHAVTNTVGVAARPGAMAYCPATDEIYVACHSSDSLTVIRGSDDFVSTVYLGAAGDSTTSIIYNPVIQRIYCADENSGTVYIVNPLTKSVEGTVALGAAAPVYPAAMAEGRGGKVFTANNWAASVSVVAWEDSTYPYIASTAPYAGATGVSFDAPITIQFSEPMDPASLAYTCSPNPGGWALQWDTTQTFLTLNHSYFTPGASHSFNVTAARNIWGSDLTAGPVPNPWSFLVRSVGTASHAWHGGRYQLLSVPLQPYDSTATGNFTDDLGAYGPSGWRLFGYDPASASNVETPPLTLGRGYWLSSVTTDTLDVTGYMLPAMGSSFVIHLGSGWNLVGDPLGVPFQLSNCSVMDSIVYFWSDTLSNGLLRQRAWVYTDETFNFRNDGRWDTDTLSPLEPEDSLRPWGGYAVYASAPCSLLVITPIPKGGQGTVAGRTEPEVDWSLSIAAQTGGVTDRVRIGVSPRALAGYDRLDGEKPPPVSDEVRLWLPHGDWGPGTWHQYSSDFRPAEDYIEWPLVLKLADQSHEALVSYRIEGALPEGQRLYLVERNGQGAFEMGGQGQAGFTGDRDLAVVLSDRGIGDLPFAPLAFGLGLPRPNPAVRASRIDYQLTRTGPVRLAVYNMLGQRVRTLADGAKQPGYYTAGWDGRDDAAALAPPGIYFVRLEAEGRQATRKLVRIR